MLQIQFSVEYCNLCKAFKDGVVQFCWHHDDVDDDYDDADINDISFW